MADSPIIEIQVAPDILAMIFRAGAIIHTNNGFHIHLKEGGVPQDYFLHKYGVDRETKQFRFIFAPRGRSATGQTIRVSPVYEKEDDHEPGT